MKSFSWEFINNEEVTKDLDYSCFEHNTSTIDKNFYSFFNLDAENKNKVNILLIDSSGNKHTSYIRHASESREASPVKLIKWNKSFTDHLKKEFPNWEEVKKGEKTENYKLVFKKTDESNTYNISTKEVTIQQLTDFTDLLISKGINPKEVQLIRHLSKVQKNMNETYYWLWKENPKAFFEAKCAEISIFFLISPDPKILSFKYLLFINFLSFKIFISNVLLISFDFFSIILCILDKFSIAVVFLLRVLKPLFGNLL